MRLPENSRAVWHLYPFRYDAAQFNGLSRDKFIRALRAEGVPCGGVYQEQYFDGLLDEAITSRGFKRLLSAERLKAYRDSFQELKGNKQVCETTVAMTQNLLLAGPPTWITSSKRFGRSRPTARSWRRRRPSVPGASQRQVHRQRERPA